MKFLTKLLVATVFLSSVTASSTYAIVDPTLSPNNKVGINSLSPEAEITLTSDLVNTNGDWGWILIVIKKSERDTNRWQKVFDQLNRSHLIPIVRLATDTDTVGIIWRVVRRFGKTSLPYYIVAFRSCCGVCGFF